MTADMNIATHTLERHATMDEYSMTSGGVLPPLGASSQISRRPNLRAYIVSPFDYRYRFWETFLVVLVFYTAWVCPFEFGFIGNTPRGVLSITDNIVNGFFAIDIVLTFFVAYVDSNTYVLVDEPTKIAWRYIKTWLAFDVISTFPNELVRKMLPTTYISYEYFNLLRLWRLRRVSAMFARIEKDINFNYFWVRVAKLVCVNLFAVHCAACAMSLVALRYPEPSRTWIYEYMPNFHRRSKWAMYVTAMYWSITTMSTTGYGDFHAVNHLEMALVTCFMILSMGLTAYLIGNMTSLVVHMTNQTRKFREKIRGAVSFAQRNQLPDRVQDQMISHLCLKYRTDKEGLHQHETLRSLPKAIRSSISHYLFYPLLSDVYLFRHVSNDLLFQLVSEMKAEYFAPREDVILQNEAPTDLYIIVTGAVELIVQDNAAAEARFQVVGEGKNGDIIGEIGVLCYRPQPYTVRTKRLSQLLRMNRVAFLNNVRANVGDGTIIMNNFLQHLKQRRDTLTQDILRETEQMIARGKVDVPLSFIFAATRGDDVLLHQLLRQGPDPNELDHDGRTALHISASKGSHHCVVLLLEYGADPNIPDSKGNVALWEAMSGRHKSITKLLADNGGTLLAGDTGRFACTAIEQNDLELLKEIIYYGGDVTVPAINNDNGWTALHAATSEGNIEIVKLLLEQGGDVDMKDNNGWTPRSLADHQGHDQIKSLFETAPKMERPECRSRDLGAHRMLDDIFIGKYSSEPMMLPNASTTSRESLSTIPDPPAGSRRQMADIYSNSLFGVMSVANRPRGEIRDSIGVGLSGGRVPARVTISCPEKEETSGKVVFLPRSFQEVLDLGVSKFGFHATKVLTIEGYEIDDIGLIRDGDHIVLAGTGGET